jgi:hypothetical protein
MPGREHEPVAVEPAGFGWIILEAVPEKDRPDLRASKRQAEVAGGASVDGIHCKAASFIGGTFKGIERKIHKL